QAAFGNKERFQAHQQPRWKTHVTCPICGKPGWKRNAERHQRSCIGRQKQSVTKSDREIDWDWVFTGHQSSQESDI
ncbi:hypothetical protein FRC20_011132, partial [Serendipita sp. 405]